MCLKSQSLRATARGPRCLGPAWVQIDDHLVSCMWYSGKTMAQKFMVPPYHCLLLTSKLLSRMLLGDWVGGTLEDLCCRTLTGTSSPLAILPLCGTCCPSSRHGTNQTAL